MWNAGELVITLGVLDRFQVRDNLFMRRIQGN